MLRRRTSSESACLYEFNQVLSPAWVSQNPIETEMRLQLNMSVMARHLRSLPELPFLILLLGTSLAIGVRPGPVFFSFLPAHLGQSHGWILLSGIIRVIRCLAFNCLHKISAMWEYQGWLETLDFRISSMITQVCILNGPTYNWHSVYIHLFPSIV